MSTAPRIAYLIDPGFPGGTSSAVAAELRALKPVAQIEVHALTSRMFKEKSIAPQIRSVLAELGLDLIWDAPTVSGDVVLLHNPSFLKFHKELTTKIIAKQLIVVTHENFLRPGGIAGFDVGQCLGLIDRASLALRKSIAPISPYNRQTVNHWLNANPEAAHWSVLQDDWFNICEFAILPPTATPSDRRGRHSRPGPEKFPGLSDMDLCFPKAAQANVILGADLFLNDKLDRPHWKMTPFGGLEVAQYFEMIDFMVYFTAATLRESFGRVLAEAISAGKIVISDPETGSVFQGAVVPARPGDVDDIIAKFIQEPTLYRDQVIKGQKCLAKFSAGAFQQFFLSSVDIKFGCAA